VKSQKTWIMTWILKRIIGCVTRQSLVSSGIPATLCTLYAYRTAKVTFREFLVTRYKKRGALTLHSVHLECTILKKSVAVTEGWHEARSFTRTTNMRCHREIFSRHGDCATWLYCVLPRNSDTTDNVWMWEVRNKRHGVTYITWTTLTLYSQVVISFIQYSVWLQVQSLL
jgi:hypothetical protein